MPVTVPETATASKTPRQMVLERAARRRKATWKRKATDKRTAKAILGACVSQATRDRLIADALQSPASGLEAAAYEGMEPAEVSAFVNSKLDKFIIAYPWWFGRLKRDQPRKPVSDAQRLALEVARQRKAAIQLEATQPYIPSDLDSMEQDEHR